MSLPLSRRHFLLGSALAGLAGVVRGDESSSKKPGANERLAVGVIGVEGQGAYNVNELARAGAELVALCDVDENRAGKTRQRFAKAKFYTDFRKLIDHKGLDAVLIATPDHGHVLPTLAALRAGYHVYCEKPLTHTVEEARLVAETAAKQKRVTQMGTQIHAGNNYRRVVEIIQSGAIGDVTDVHVVCGKSWGGKGVRPMGNPPVPPGLHFDLWLGPAPERPYNPAYLPAEWRRFWDFGGGTLNDMACHHIDLPFWALKLRHPTHVRAEGPKPSSETTPESLQVEYQFPARGDMPALKLTWSDGGRRPKVFEDPKVAAWRDGSLFIGTKGMLLANYDTYKLLPEKDFEGFQPPKPTIPNSIGHHKEWIEACKKNEKTTCNFDYSGALTETVLLGTVAFRSGWAFTWDAAKLKTSETEADRFLTKEYRKGWSLS
jgi:predicted dehydrogenase